MKNHKIVLTIAVLLAAQMAHQTCAMEQNVKTVAEPVTQGLKDAVAVLVTPETQADINTIFHTVLPVTDLHNLDNVRKH